MNIDSIHPLSHRILVETTPLLPPGEFGIGHYMPSNPFYSPLEVPAYVIIHLLSFLKGITTVVPRFLEAILPQNEVPAARATFQSLISQGMDESEAMMTMGLLTKARVPSVPPISIARVIRSACDCLKKEEYVAISTTAGEPLALDEEGNFKLIRCVEAFGATEARTLASVKEEEAACEARRRAAFARARSFRVA